MAGSGSGFAVGTIVWFASAAVKAGDGGVIAFAENCVNDAVVIQALASSLAVSGVVSTLLSYAVKRVSITAMSKTSDEAWDETRAIDNVNRPWIRHFRFYEKLKKFAMRKNNLILPTVREIT